MKGALVFRSIPQLPGFEGGYTFEITLRCSDGEIPVRPDRQPWCMSWMSRELMLSSGAVVHGVGQLEGAMAAARYDAIHEYGHDVTEIVVIGWPAPGGPQP